LTVSRCCLIRIFYLKNIFMGQERDSLVHFVRLANALLNNETNNFNAWPFTLQFAIWGPARFSRCEQALQTVPPLPRSV